MPVAAAGAFGAAMAAAGLGGFGWLSNSFERGAWTAAFAGVTAAAAASAWPALTSELTSTEEPLRQLLLGPSAACVLAATVAERLGGAAGRVLLLPLVGAACLGSHQAIHNADFRYEQVMQGSALLLVPLLHLCPSVHTHSRHSLLSLSWFLAAVVYHNLPTDEGWYISSSSCSRLLLAAALPVEVHHGSSHVL